MNFPDGSGGSTVNQLLVMVDVNETGGPQTINMDRFDIVWNYSGFSPASDVRNNPHANDISSSVQNSTGTGYSGGTLLANTLITQVLGQQSVGAGHADQAIFTGVDPFDPMFADSDRFLLHWESSDHDNGGETIFLDGRIGPNDLVTPEPASMGVFALAAVWMTHRRRRAC